MNNNSLLFRLKQSHDLPALDYNFQLVEFIDFYEKEIMLNVLVQGLQYTFQQ